MRGTKEVFKFIEDETFILEIPSNLTKEILFDLIKTINSYVEKEFSYSVFTKINFHSMYEGYYYHANKNFINTKTASKVGWCFLKTNTTKITYIGMSDLNFFKLSKYNYGRIVSLEEFFDYRFENFWDKFYFFKSKKFLERELNILKNVNIKDKDIRIESITRIIFNRKENEIIL